MQQFEQRDWPICSKCRTSVLSFSISRAVENFQPIIILVAKCHGKKQTVKILEVILSSRNTRIEMTLAFDEGDENYEDS